MLKWGLLVAVALLLLGAPGATAKVPNFEYGPASIKPGRFIGGVEVGMTRAEAAANWSRPDTCFQYGRGTIACQYNVLVNFGTGPRPTPIATFYVKAGRVVAISIELRGNPQQRAKVKRLQTQKGVKVGDQMAEARRKYNIPPPTGGEAGMSRAQIKQGNRCTLFYAPEEPYKTISSITLGICRSGTGI
jgi:hypothetical protein